MGLFGKKNKTFCYSCKKEFGRVSVKWKLAELKDKKSPEGMSTDDRICSNCKENLPKIEKQKTRKNDIKKEHIKQSSNMTFQKNFQGSSGELKGAELDTFTIDFADLYLAKKFEDCVRLAESYLKKYPYDIHVNKNLIDAYFSTGNIKKSKIILENAIKHHPKNAYFRSHLAGVYSNLSEPEKMASVLREGIELGLEFEAGCSEEEYMRSLENAEKQLSLKETGGKKYQELEEIVRKEEERSIVCAKRMGYFALIIAKKTDYDGTNYALELLYDKRDESSEMNHVRVVKALDEQIKKIEFVIDSWETDGSQSKNNNSPNNSKNNESSLNILKFRLASGEITNEEFLELTSVIEEN
jgi:hypothetical protein